MLATLAERSSKRRAVGYSAGSSPSLEIDRQAIGQAGGNEAVDLGQGVQHRGQPVLGKERQFVGVVVAFQQQDGLADAGST